MKDRSDDPSHHERMLLPRSYISLLGDQNRDKRFLKYSRVLVWVMNYIKPSAECLWHHMTQTWNIAIFLISKIYRNKVKKRTVFNETRLYNIQIFDKMIFLKHRTRQIKATEYSSQAKYTYLLHNWVLWVGFLMFNFFFFNQVFYLKIGKPLSVTLGLWLILTPHTFYLELHDVRHMVWDLTQIVKEESPCHHYMGYSLFNNAPNTFYLRLYGIGIC